MGLSQGNSLPEANIHALVKFGNVKVWALSIDGTPLLDEISKDFRAIEQYKILPTELQTHERSIFM